MKEKDLTIKDIELIVKLDKQVVGEEITNNTIRTDEYHYAEVYERFRIAKEKGDDKFFNRIGSGNSSDLPWNSDGSKQGQKKTDMDGRKLRTSFGQKVKEEKKSSKPLTPYFILNKESEFTFGRYNGKKVGEVLKEDSTYIGWLYYNAERCSFTEDIIAFLDIERIRKPGTDNIRFKRWKESHTNEKEETYQEWK